MYKAYASEHSTPLIQVSTIVTDGLWRRSIRSRQGRLQFLQDHTEYHRMQCNFRTTWRQSQTYFEPLLKFVTFARLTTCGISLPRITVKTCKRLSEEKSRLNSFEDESRLNLQGKGAIRYLLRNHEKSHQTKFLINGDTAQQPSLSSPTLGAVAASKSPPMLWCSSLGTLHVKCPFTSFHFLSFLFPCWARWD